MDLIVVNVGTRFGVCLNGNIARTFDTREQAIIHAAKLREQL